LQKFLNDFAGSRVVPDYQDLLARTFRVLQSDAAFCCVQQGRPVDRLHKVVIGSLFHRGLGSTAEITQNKVLFHGILVWQSARPNG
jgi:ubiquinone/menaquinone biosynthesis C-methylase UbiE